MTERGEMGRLADRYVLKTCLGSGTYGEVYRATDTFLDREVAVKILRPAYTRDDAAVARFFREAQYAAKLSPHPHIVTVFDLVRAGDLTFLVLEYIRGADLRSVIAQQAPLLVPTAAAILDGILDGLSAAHQWKIIHRDVKPGNVVLDPSGQPKLTDFGIARALSDVALTTDQTSLGTIPYMAPEQIRLGQVSAQTDLYAAGIILFEMLTGQQPFQGEQHYEIALKHLEEPVPSPRGLNATIPVLLEQVILRALEKTPQRRFADADEMRAALRASIVSDEAEDEQESQTGLRPATSQEKKEARQDRAPRLASPQPTAMKTVPLPSQSPPIAPTTGRSNLTGYEHVLRAIGTYLDQEPTDRITLMEGSDGFLLRKQRSLHTTQTVMVHFQRDQLERLVERLQRETPRRRRIRHPGLWARFPQGHQDFFRALGHELDAVAAHDVVLDEGQDSLLVTYSRPGDSRDEEGRHLVILQVEDIERILNVAFERRADPRRRFGLTPVAGETVIVGNCVR
jgi:serine/threonine protein kinase